MLDKVSCPATARTSRVTTNSRLPRRCPASRPDQIQRLIVSGCRPTRTTACRTSIRGRRMTVTE